jgi:hypothetical protein
MGENVPRLTAGAFGRLGDMDSSGDPAVLLPIERNGQIYRDWEGTT